MSYPHSLTQVHLLATIWEQEEWRKPISDQQNIMDVEMAQDVDKHLHAGFQITVSEDPLTIQNFEMLFKEHRMHKYAGNICFWKDKWELRSLLRKASGCSSWEKDINKPNVIWIPYIFFPGICKAWVVRIFAD